MGYFVHLKDDVVFAYHESSTEVDIPGDNIIPVENDGEKYLNKKYVNGSFIDAPLIRYAILHNGVVVGIGKTIFSSEAGDNLIISNNEVDVNWTWDGNNFSSPTAAVSYDTILVADSLVTTSAAMPAVSAETLEAMAAINATNNDLGSDPALLDD